MRTLLILLLVSAGLFVIGVAGYKIVRPKSVAPVSQAPFSSTLPTTPPEVPTAPVAAPPPVPAQPPAGAAPASARIDPPVKPRTADWRLRDDQDFSKPAPAPAQTLSWYGPVAAPTSVHAFDASGQFAQFTALLVLPSQRRPVPFSMSERCPHAVKWELTIIDPSRDERGAFMGYQNKTVAFDERGCSLISTSPDAAMPLGPNVVVFERFDGRLTCSLNGLVTKSFDVGAQDRVPLRVFAELAAVAIVRARVYTNGGEDLQDPPAKPAAAAVEPTWVEVFRNSFDAPASMERILPWAGDIAWREEQQALLVGIAAEHQDAFAAIHGSLPGDLRIRFRTLRRKSAPQVSIGVFLSTDGLTAMDGYFVEWGRGMAQVKKRRNIEKHVEAPTPNTPDRWVRCEVSRIGGTIAMRLEDEPILTWTDPHPPRDDRHDLCCFYVWGDSTLVDDVVIERNAADPIRPRADDPARLEWMAEGRPQTAQAAADDGNF
ncbi:MAG: hypothetical protein H0V44_16085 [Planctomycetes bacterium]|nr:hypothetical protein [Planctomycetota bacterium]